MALGKIKKKDHEKLDDANIERVIELLEAEKPITIKAACEELNIAPNGTRLKKIIQDYHDRLAENKRRRAANRGKPANDYEISTIVESFLVGEPLKAIADHLYRPVSFVKDVIDRVGVPQAFPGEDYTNFQALPDQCVAESFDEGEFIWSSRYASIAEVRKCMGPNPDGIDVYRVWIHQRIDPEKAYIDGKRYSFQPETGGGFYAHQCVYDLGSLRHLLQYKVDVKRAIK